MKRVTLLHTPYHFFHHLFKTVVVRICGITILIITNEYDFSSQFFFLIHPIRHAIKEHRSQTG